MEHAHNGITYTDQFLSGELQTENFEALSAETELEFYPDLSLDEGLEDPDLGLFQGNSPSLSYRSQSPDDMENEDLADLGMSGLGWEAEDSDRAGSVPDLASHSNPFAGDSGGMAAYAENSDSLDDIDEFADSDFGDPFALDDGGFEAADVSSSKVSGKSAPYSGDSFSEAPTQMLNGQSFASSEIGNSFDSNQLDSPTGPRTILANLLLRWICQTNSTRTPTTTTNPRPRVGKITVITHLRQKRKTPLPRRCPRRVSGLLDLKTSSPITGRTTRQTIRWRKTKRC